MVLVGLLLLALAVLGIGGGLGGDDSQPGTALDLGAREMTTQRLLAKGQSFISMLASVENGSEESLVLTALAPVWGSEDEGAVEVTGIRVGLRSARSPAFGNYYSANPPSDDSSGECLTQPLRPVQGFELEPGESAAIAASLRVVKQGAFYIEGYSVEYEHDGQVFEEVIPTGFSGRVTRDRPSKALLNHPEGCE